MHSKLNNKKKHTELTNKICFALIIYTNDFSDTQILDHQKKVVTPYALEAFWHSIAFSIKLCFV